MSSFSVCSCTYLLSLTVKKLLDTLLNVFLAIAVDNLTNRMEEIPFPVLEASVVDKMLNENIGNLPDDIDKVICDVYFSEGGQFIGNETIENKMLPSVLELFATLLEYKKEVRYTKFNHKIYDALPSFFVELANGSRKDTGFRLLRRCARHAMDCNARSLINTDAKIFQRKDGSVGILLQNKVPASMKDKTYNTYAAFTAKDLVSCKCSCHCGASGDEAVVCVHILPLIFQLTLLLMEGLSENILLELCARFQEHHEEDLSVDQSTLMNKSMDTLIAAAGVVDCCCSLLPVAASGCRLPARLPACCLPAAC